MQHLNYYFIALLVATTIYAFARGGTPERIGAAAYCVSDAATHFVLNSHVGHKWIRFEDGVFLIDLLIFITFCLLALRADRFWPIWVSALLGLGVLGHFARWYAPEIHWYAYAVVLTIWSYPILLLIALGTWNYRRSRARAPSPPSPRRGEGRGGGPRRLRLPIGA
jgi:hypothetical protein